MSSDSNVKQAVPFFGVSDMEKSLQFYPDGLGFEMTRRWIDQGSIRWCWLQRGGAALMLQEYRRDGGIDDWKPDGELGLGVSIMFICADAIAIYRAAISRGLTASRPFVSNGMWLTSLRDPDGYNIGFESATDAPEESELDDGRVDSTVTKS